MPIPQNEGDAEREALLAGEIDGKMDIAKWVTSGFIGAREMVALIGSPLSEIVNGFALTVKAKRVQLGEPTDFPHISKVTLANGEVVIVEIRQG